MSLKILFFPLSVIVSIIIFIWFTKPAWDELGVQKEALIEINEEFDGLAKGVASFGKAASAYKEMKNDDKQAVLSAIPQSTSNDDFIAEIDMNAIKGGVHLISADVKKERGKVSKCESAASMAASSSSSEEGAGTNPVQCPKEKTKFSATLEVAGEYFDIQDFIKKIDLQNRIITPVELSINKIESENKENSQMKDLLKAEFSFNFYSREKDENLNLSQMQAGGNKVFDSIFKGSLALTNALEFRQMRELKAGSDKLYFRPVAVTDNQRKKDLFKGNGTTSPAPAPVSIPTATPSNPSLGTTSPADSGGAVANPLPTDSAGTTPISNQ